MSPIKIPAKYSKLNVVQRIQVREKYIELQKGLCFYCKGVLGAKPPKKITDKKIHWDFFPNNFLKHPIHLQHDHATGLTEGAVHAYCNAVMWEYEGR